MSELNTVHLLIIGAVASILVQGLKLLAASYGVQLHRNWLVVILLVISLALAWIFAPPVLPTATDPMAYLQALLTQAGAMVGVATLVYNVLLEKMTGSLGLTPEKFLPTPAEPEKPA